jgi:hypothetical protein
MILLTGNNEIRVNGPFLKDPAVKLRLNFMTLGVPETLSRR